MNTLSRLMRKLPMPLRRTGRGAINYVQRISIWRGILREIRGVTPGDQRALQWSALAAPATAWGNFYAWRDPVLLSAVDVEVQGLGRFRVHARCDELYLLLPQREKAIYDAARTLLRPGDTVIDAGANIGAFSVFAGRLIGPGGRLIAIEMMPRTAARLRDNLARNRIAADVVETALAIEAGRSVSAAVDPAKAGQATLMLAHTLDRPERLVVTTQTLDEVAANTGRIALLKLDIEGAELDALAGAAGLLTRTSAVIFEALDDSGSIAALLTQAGFAVERLDHHNYLARCRIA